MESQEAGAGKETPSEVIRLFCKYPPCLVCVALGSTTRTPVPNAADKRAACVPIPAGDASKKTAKQKQVTPITFAADGSLIEIALGVSSSGRTWRN